MLLLFMVSVNGVIYVKFYRLVELDFDLTAQGQVDAVYQKFEEDRITDLMSERLIGVVSDSASVMTGRFIQE